MKSARFLRGVWLKPCILAWNYNRNVSYNYSEFNKLLYFSDFFSEPYLKKRNNPHLKPLTKEEIKAEQEKNRELMKKLYEGD
jgi:hypothetical protein